mmetsp:Transcript_103902/g.300534  ORF Transcript_103902/g.300534 Transcript_103902/m.300534 type:complete len:290 (-) Transcript_103902:358-1227(-)
MLVLWRDGHSSVPLPCELVTIRGGDQSQASSLRPRRDLAADDHNRHVQVVWLIGGLRLRPLSGLLLLLGVSHLSQRREAHDVLERDAMQVRVQVLLQSLLQLLLRRLRGAAPCRWRCHGEGRRHDGVRTRSAGAADIRRAGRQFCGDIRRSRFARLVLRRFARLQVVRLRVWGQGLGTEQALGEIPPPLFAVRDRDRKGACTERLGARGVDGGLCHSQEDLLFFVPLEGLLNCEARILLASAAILWGRRRCNGRKSRRKCGRGYRRTRRRKRCLHLRCVHQGALQVVPS